MNHNDAGRLYNTAGIVTTHALHPTLLSTRMRNSVIRQIQAGVAAGGWASHAARLARMLMAQYGIPNTPVLYESNWLRVRPNGTPISDAVKAELHGLVDAGAAVYKMKLDRHYSGTMDKRQQDSHEVIDRGYTTFWACNMFDDNVAASANKVIVGYYLSLPDVQEKIAQAVADMRGHNPIQLESSRIDGVV